MTTDPNETPRDPREMPPTQQQVPQTPPSGPGPDETPDPVNPGSYGPSGGQYGAPSPGSAYGPYDSYGPGGAYGPGGTPPPTGGAYAAPLGAPVPAGMRNIWQKWLNVTTKPGVASVAQELPTANWRDIWLSLIGLGILTAITGAISSLYTVQRYTIPQADGTTTTIHVPTGASWGSIIGVPLGFFIGVAILFVFAKIFSGTGTFLVQSYAMMLYYVPLQAVAAVLGLLPILGGLAGFALAIYGIVLAVFAIAASQRLTIGKSVAVVLLPAIIVLFLACGLLVIFAAIIAAALNGTR